MVYIFSDRKKRYSTSFAITLVMLPVVVSVVIMLVGSNIASAISLGGVFALVRFRSVPGDSKDIATVFFAMSVGLACGLGYILFAAVFGSLVGILYFLLVYFGYAAKNQNAKDLKITIPESLNFYDAFDDLFELYTHNTDIVKVKTTNMGTLYEITYRIVIKNDSDLKQFIDALRCRNGNLNIIVSQIPDNTSIL